MARVQWNGAELLARVRRGAEIGIAAATEDLRTEVVRLILETPKSGRIYRRRSVTHRASAPGEPPASDTGRLVGSVRTNLELEALRGSVVAGTNYAPLLEFGTARMAPRPFMRPALANRRAAIEKTVVAAIGAALK